MRIERERRGSRVAAMPERRHAALPAALQARRAAARRAPDGPTGGSPASGVVMRS
jgi:hypothetical protein